MQDADDRVDTVSIHGQPRMLALGDDGLDLLGRQVQIDADDFIVRRHDVIDRDLLEVQNAQEHLAVAR